MTVLEAEGLLSGQQQGRFRLLGCQFCPRGNLFSPQICSIQGSFAKTAGGVSQLVPVELLLSGKQNTQTPRTGNWVKTALLGLGCNS